jgi:hypothetical protein
MGDVNVKAVLLSFSKKRSQIKNIQSNKKIKNIKKSKNNKYTLLNELLCRNKKSTIFNS